MLLFTSVWSGLLPTLSLLWSFVVTRHFFMGLIRCSWIYVYPKAIFNQIESIFKADNERHKVGIYSLLFPDFLIWICDKLMFLEYPWQSTNSALPVQKTNTFWDQHTSFILKWRRADHHMNRFLIGCLNSNDGGLMNIEHRSPIKLRFITSKWAFDF